MIASLRELNSKKELFRQQREAQWDMVSAKGYDHHRGEAPRFRRRESQDQRRTEVTLGEFSHCEG